MLSRDDIYSGNPLGAFNVFNVESIRAVAEAAFESHSRIYLQTSPSFVNYFGARNLRQLIDLVTADLDQSLMILHLDHCADEKVIMDCIEAGWQSVMVDGSSFDLNRNIELTKTLGDIAHANGVLVEGELGSFAGEEDGAGPGANGFVRPEDVSRFVDATGIDLLAVGIGNKHGYYDPKNYKLEFGLLEQVNVRIPRVPLVLHGGSGIPSTDIQRAVNLGVRKVNFSTELKDAFLAAVANHATGADRFNMMSYQRSAVKAVKALVLDKISSVKAAP